MNRPPILALLVAESLAFACSSDESGDKTASGSGSVDLTGAGATFPYPLYSKWFSDYAAATGVKINISRSGQAAESAS